MATVEHEKQVGVESDKEGETETFEDAQDSAAETIAAPEEPVAVSSMPKDATTSASASSTPKPPDAAKTPEVTENGSVDTKSTAEPDGETPTVDGAAEKTVDNKQDAKLEVPQKSPLLTGHRVSVSSVEDAQLDDKAASETQERSRTLEPQPQTSSARSVSPSKFPLKTRGLSGNLPSMPWGTTSPKPSATTPSSSTAPPKKLGMSFSWLSRGSSNSKETDPSQNLPPPSNSTASQRRGTVTSITSLTSNPELMLSKLGADDEQGGEATGTNGSGKQRDSLRERFKMLRMREEAGIRSPDLEGATSPGGVFAGLVGRSASFGVGIASPASVSENKTVGLASSPPSSPDPNVTPKPPPSADSNLPPGTAAGVSAGASTTVDPSEPVDWDLWQTVVYEGPAAVARTSAEELNQAIAAGIPSAIRGVVWQVLAQSKNEDLENVYKELVVRGTDKDPEHLAAMNGQPLQRSTSNGPGKDMLSVASSRSSVHSDHSTPATTVTNGVSSPTPTPTQEKDTEAAAKLQVAMAAERKAKAKEDAQAFQKLERVIRRDLGARTSYSKYAAAAGLQDGLFGVCKAYALFDEGVGYAQGMNFLVMPLLFSMPEEEAFCLLVRMMNQYGLRDMFIQDMPGLHLRLYQFERLLEDLEPALYCHLHRRNVTPQLYATQWFLTLFAYRFPLQLVLRVYDLLLSEGLEGAILKFGIVLMQKNAEALLEMNDMSSLTTFLKERLFDIYIDQTPSSNSILESGFFGSSGGIDKEVYRADMLVQDACAVKITPAMLKVYSTEWEEKQRAEKEREDEMEGLKTSNASLTLKVRSLEERIEKSDTEHVQMASELVRTKVENQELHDSAESLKVQTEELRGMVERQPEEVEQRLKAEMDRIMQRNVEVQNENRGLEEQMAEMEKDLVQTKMQFAETNSEHESLKQKWLDLRKAIGA